MVQELSRLLTLSIYTTNADRRNRLLHYPSRGAYTELQVLAVLENIGIARADSASALELHKLQPAELQGAFAALVDSKQGQHILAAAQQQLVPEILQTRNVRIVHNVMMQVQVNAAAMHFQSASWSRGSNTESMVRRCPCPAP